MTLHFITRTVHHSESEFGSYYITHINAEAFKLEYTARTAHDLNSDFSRVFKTLEDSQNCANKHNEFLEALNFYTT